MFYLLQMVIVQRPKSIGSKGRFNINSDGGQRCSRLHSFNESPQNAGLPSTPRSRTSLWHCDTTVCCAYTYIYIILYTVYIYIVYIYRYIQRYIQIYTVCMHMHIYNYIYIYMWGGPKMGYLKLESF
jgi:hypothetical protein